MERIAPYEAVLLDIEGTTTPISFVYETLFPFARQHLDRFLADHWEDSNVRQDVELVIKRARQLGEEYADDPDFVPVPQESSNEKALRSAVVRHLQWQMDRDMKTTGLKSLQGRIWRAGYRSGELKAPVYEDVPDAFESWTAADTPIYIYSSGSVEAQKLLFGHTDYGDLTGAIDGYFDTRTGNKKEPASYTAICEAVDVAPGDLVFVTDSLEEARAADEADVQALISQRPANPDLPDHDFPVIESLDAVAER